LATQLCIGDAKNRNNAYLLTEKGDLHIINMHDGEIYNYLLNLGANTCISVDAKEKWLISVDEQLHIKVLERIKNV
jgi:hypothetical protein